MTRTEGAKAAAPGWRAQAGIAALFFGFVLASRLPVFSRSVLDWDESLYFLIAAQWRAGHLPYTTIWDNKPIGIYAIFVVFQAVFGETVTAIRTASVVFVSLTAFAVFHITRLLTAPAACLRCAVAAGLVFCLASLSNDGLAANTELFMDCFTAGAVLAALRMAGSAAPLRLAMLCGLCAGAAAMIKYVAVFEAPAIFLLLLWQKHGWRAAGGFMIGAALPAACAVLLYALAGQLPLWWDCSIAANFRRVAAAFPPGTLTQAAWLQLRRWGPLYAGGLAIAFLAAWQAARRGRGPLAHGEAMGLFLCLWLLGGCLGVAAAKSFYDHYFLQILPVLCVALGRLTTPAVRRPKTLFAVVILLVSLPPALAAARALADASRPDDTRLAAADILAGPPDASVYVFDSQPIIYALTNRPPPTRYVLPSVLAGTKLAYVAGVDPVAEVARILARQPEFIVRNHFPPAAGLRNEQVYVLLDQALAGYHLWRREGSIDVYQRRQANAPP